MNSRRRLTVQATGCLALAALAPLRAPLALLPPGEAFDAKDVESVLRAFPPNPAASTAVSLDLAEHIEGASSVPVKLSSDVPNTTSLILVVDRNPWPLIAAFDLTPAAAPSVGLRIRIAESSIVRAIALGRDGKSYVATKNVNVIGGGCSSSDAEDEADRAEKTDPMRIRARLVSGNSADVILLLVHPMENGLRTTKSGRTIPAHFVRQFTADVNGKQVLRAHFGRSVATNPQISFRLVGVKAEDSLTLSWEDSRGLSRSDQARISA